MLTSSTFWIIVAVVIALLLIALITGLLLRRRRVIDLRDTVEAPPATPHKSTYQADSAISFAAGPSTVAEPVTPDKRPETDRGVDAPKVTVPTDSTGPSIADVPPVADTAVGSPDSGSTAVGEAAVIERPLPPEDTAPTTTTGTTPVDTAPVDTATSDTSAEDLVVERVPTRETAPAAPVEEIAPPEGRLERLRGRLAGSRSAFGQSLLGLLGAGDLDEESWEDVEATLLKADLGATMTEEIVQRLRAEIAAGGVKNADEARAALRGVLVQALLPEMDRSVRALPHGLDGDRRPGVVLVAGVNGTGKTTTTGKLARVLVASGRHVVLGAADTFRAAAADQLATWGQRVGAEVVRGKEGADPAAVAFDAVKRASADGADTVLVDTAGRLHTKGGLMDELGKVKRVVEKQAIVDEVLLVLDATTGQNGVVQAKVFGEVVKVTGIVLTKLDGTAKGGIVFRVQRELGVPVKLVGLGEGPDDLAPFEPEAFVDALLA